MKEIQTNISHVTLYPHQAQIKRQGSIRLDQGTHQLSIPNLPPKTQPESLRASIQGAALLHGIHLQKQFFSRAPSEAVKALEGEIETLKDNIRTLDDKHQALESEAGQLENLGKYNHTFARALAEGKLSLEKQLELFRGLRLRLEEIRSEQRELAIQKRELNRKLEQLERELEQIRAARPRQRYTVHLDLEVRQAGEITVSLHYLVDGASWKPAYELRLSDQQSPNAELTYLALVRQQTGEDWQDVQLTLSTARPSWHGFKPELDPWYISPAPPTREEPSRKMMAMSAPTGEGAPPEAEPDFAEAALEQSLLGLSYTASAPATIPQDNQPHKVPVALLNLPVTLSYVCVPKRVEEVYRQAELVNQSAFTLLPGKVSLFHGDEFVGTSDIELTAAQGKLEFTLSPDDKIRVKRELTRREVDKTALGGKRRVRYGYRIEIENLYPQRITLEVLDQLPLSQHEDIKVKLESVSPKPDQHDNLNILRWKRELPAHTEVGKETLTFEFTIEYPPEMHVRGLP